MTVRRLMALALAIPGCGAGNATAQYAQQSGYFETREAPEAPEAPETAETAAPDSCPSGMALIPAGSFTMGSNDFDDEKDPHEVPLAAFCLDRHEVTVGEYRGCGGCSPPGTAEYCNWGVSGRDRHPINCVDWDQATAYCSSQGKRLPTEEEWEYAARGSEGRTYPWGDAAPGSQLCWERLGDGKPNSTCEVESYPAGLFGLFDMAGNVWEWTSGRYCPYTSKNCAEYRRVFRGGSWSGVVPLYVRGANRHWNAPGSRLDNLGFRCAR